MKNELLFKSSWYEDTHKNKANTKAARMRGNMKIVHRSKNPISIGSCVLVPIIKQRII